MATSGNMSTSNEYIKYSITVTQNSQSIANNTSNVTVSVRFWRTNTGYTTYGNGTVYCKINGTTYSAEVTSDYKITNSGIVLFTKTLDIGHNSDGSKTLSCSAWISHSRFSSNEQSYSQVLTTIPRKSTLSASNGTLNTAQTLTVTKQSSGFTHTITYKCGGSSGTVCTKSSSTSISWTPPLSLAAQNTTGTSVTIVFTIETFNGSNSLGTNTKTITCSIPSSVVPSVSFTVSDSTGYASTYGAYVQNKSKASVSISASGSQGSTIKSYSATIDGSSYNSSSFTTGVLKNTGTLTVSVKVTDSRGRTASASKTITVLAYSSPKISAFSAFRCDSSGTATSSGEYLCINFSAAITSLDSKNTAAYVLKYKKASESSYTSVTLSSYAGNYSVSGGSYVFSADASSSYDLSLTATDAFSSFTKTASGSSVSKTFSIFGKGLGFAFGKVAELADYLDVAWNIRGRKNITSDVDISAGGNITSGNDITASSNVNAGNKVVANSDVVSGGIVYPRYGTIVHQCLSGQGTSGWFKFVQLKVKGVWNDEPIIFEIKQRGYFGVLAVRFNSADTTDPTLAYIRAVGFGLEGYIIKSDTSTWDIYLKKIGSYDDIVITGLHFGKYGRNRTTITWKDETVSSVSGGTSSNSGPFEINTKFGFSKGCLYHAGVQIIQPVTLWSGTMASGGSATISNINKYNVYAVRLSDATMLIGIRNTWAPNNTSGTLNATISYDGGSSVGSYNYKATFSISGTTVTLTAASKHKLLASGTTHEAATLNVNYIYGLF